MTCSNLKWWNRLPHRERKPCELSNEPQKQGPGADAPFPLLGVDAGTGLVTALMSAGAATYRRHDPDTGRKIELIPDGYHIEDIEKYTDRPRRIEHKVIFNRMRSFADYVIQFKDVDSRLFCNEPGGVATVILDYSQVAQAKDAVAVPRWHAHAAVLTRSTSPEFAAWSKILCGKWLSQAELVEFLEDNLADIVDPDQATVLESVSMLEAKRTVRFKSGVKTHNGDLQFAYEQETTATAGTTKGVLNVPMALKVAFPLWKGEPVVTFEIRLKYRIQEEGGLTFCLKPLRYEKTIDDAGEAWCQAVGEAVGMVPLFGVPGL